MSSGAVELDKLNPGGAASTSSPPPGDLQRAAAPGDDDDDDSGSAAGLQGNSAKTGAGDAASDEGDDDAEGYAKDDAEAEERRRRNDPRKVTQECVATHIARLKREIHKKRQYRLLALYSFGVLVLVVILLLAKDISMSFYTANAIENALITQPFDNEDSIPLKDWEMITSPFEWWMWVRGPLLSTLKDSSDGVSPMITPHNMLLGKITFRQSRVKADSCSYLHSIEKMLKHNGTTLRSSYCYGSWNGRNEDKNPFGPSGRQWTWRKTKAPGAFGPSTAWYSGNGYVVELSRDGNEAEQQIKQLEVDGFLDRQTRAIVTTVNTFNAGTNTMMSSVFLAEFTAGGKTWVDVSLRTFRPDMYLTSVDYFRLALEIVFGLWVLVMVGRVVYEVAKRVYEKKSFVLWLMNPWWNLVGLINLIGIVAIVIW
eukprot:m51a1_g4066 putative polycystic kidney disease 2-like 1 (426) ;mRNA; r:749944-751673